MIEENYNILSSILGELKLSEFDVRVYCSVLKKGTTTVSSLARELQVERPTVYAALERLRRKGLMPLPQSQYTRSITVEPPSRLISLLEKQKTILAQYEVQIKKILPELMAEYAVKGRISEFRLFEGREQFLTVFEEVLREAKDEILYFGDATTFIQYEGIECEENWIKGRIRRELRIRILVFKDAITRKLQENDKKELRQTRFIPDNAKCRTSFMAYGPKTLLWNPVAERAIVIDDPLVTEMFRAIFSFLWEKFGA